MLARAKASPGKLTYVITSLGSIYHLIGSWVQQGRRRYGAGALSRFGQRGDHVIGGRVRRHALHRDLGLSAHRQRPVPRAGGDVADQLSAVARRTDGCRDLAGVHYMSWLGMAMVL